MPTSEGAISPLPCRACQNDTRFILDLGHSPLANALLLQPEDAVAVYPNGLVECLSCRLVQNVTSLDTSTLFEKDYPYFSGVSKTVNLYAQDLSKAIAKRTPTQSIALEIGSNDGTMQRALAQQGIRCIGIDPAKGPVDAAQKAGLEAYRGTLDADFAKTLVERYGGFDVVTMSNVFAHVPDPVGLLNTVKAVLKPGGLLSIEAQSWLDLVESGAFDMVYHEHHSHYSLTSLAATLNRAGFAIEEVEKTTAQGGSLRIFGRNAAHNSDEISQAIAAEAEQVRSAEVALSQKVAAFKASAQAFARDRKDCVIGGYGAAAKTVTTLSACGVDLPLTAIADKAPSKIGKFLPINATPIVGLDDLLARSPDCIILFAWNLADEILPDLKGYEVWAPFPVFQRIQ